MRQLVAGLLLLQGSGGTSPALLPHLPVYSDQAILTDSLRKQLEGFCKRHKTDYRCQEDAASVGMKALSTVTPADLDNADLPLSGEEFEALLDIAKEGLFERDPPSAEQAGKADGPRALHEVDDDSGGAYNWTRALHEMDDDSGGAYWTTAGMSTPHLGLGSWLKAGSFPRASCAVVGSGAALSGRGLGPEIDAHDVVVVVNNMPSKADHADMGSRMDVFFLTAVGIHSKTGPTGERMVVSTGGRDPAVTPICHTSGEDDDVPRCIDRFKALIVRSILHDSPGQPQEHCMRDFANTSEVGLGWSGTMVTNLVHHLRRPGLPDEGKPTTGFHAVVTMALLCSSVELYGFTGTDTYDGRTEGVVHNIEGEHRVLQRLLSKSIPQSEFPDETTFRAWETTNVSLVL
jgi:hypothetical protein